jgi:hypothetical protein
MKKGLFVLSFCCSLLFANNDNEEQKKMMLNQAFIDLADEENIKTFRETRDRKDFVENEFLNLNELKVSNVPEIKNSNDTIKIIMHPEFPKTLIFEESRITNVRAYPSNAIAVFADEFNLNTLELKINNSFKKGTVVVKYLDSKGAKKIQNVFIESFSAKKDSMLFLTTNIKNVSKLSPIDILKAYQKLNNTIPNNGSSVVINNIAYRFIEDRVNGFITINNRKFRIEQTFSK